MAIDDRLALSRVLEELYEAVTLGLENSRAELGVEEEWDRLLDLWRAQLPRITEVRSALEQGGSSLDDALENVGLTGEERQLKHDVFRAASAAYDAEPTSRRFGDVLEAADITLGSLGLIFPVVHAIEEIPRRSSSTSSTRGGTGFEIGSGRSGDDVREWAVLGRTSDLLLGGVLLRRPAFALPGVMRVYGPPAELTSAIRRDSGRIGGAWA